jgi:hypothetical protein
MWLGCVGWLEPPPKLIFPVTPIYKKWDSARDIRPDHITFPVVHKNISGSKMLLM